MKTQTIIGLFAFLFFVLSIGILYRDTNMIVENNPCWNSLNCNVNVDVIQRTTM